MTAKPLIVFDFVDTVATLECDATVNEYTPFSVHSEIRPILADLAAKADLAVIHAGANQTTVQAWLRRTDMDTTKWSVIAGAGDFKSIALDSLGAEPLRAASNGQRLLLYVGLSSYRRWLLKTRLGARSIPHLSLAQPMLAALEKERDDRIGYFTVDVPIDESGARSASMESLLSSYPIVPVAFTEKGDHAELSALATGSTIEELSSGSLRPKPWFADVGDCDIVEILTSDLDAEEEDVLRRRLSFRYPPRVRGSTFLAAVPGDPRLSLPHPPRAPHGHSSLQSPLRPQIFHIRQIDLDPQVLSEPERNTIKGLSSADYEGFFRPICGLEELNPGSGPLGLNRDVREPNAGNRQVTDYLKTRMESLLAGVPDSSVRLCEFEDGRTVHHSVEARIGKNTSNEIVILGAHLDSFADWAPHCPRCHQIAPGADDDASGVAGVLLALRTIAEFAKTRAPRRQIRFLLFNAEEYVMLGSHKYASRLDPATEFPVAMIQLDMIGWIDRRKPKRFAIRGPGLDYRRLQRDSDRIADVLENAIKEVARGYDAERSRSNELDPMAARSDHTSFYAHRYPACLLMELGDPKSAIEPAQPPEFNPAYHTECDRFLNRAPPADDDYSLAVAITRVATAAVWKLAKTIP